MSERAFPEANDHGAHAPSTPFLHRKRGRALSAAAVLVFFLGAACAHYEPPPPEAPVQHALHERPAPEQEEDLKIHRAPPPSYGNKVVLSPIVSVPEG